VALRPPILRGLGPNRTLGSREWPPTRSRVAVHVHSATGAAISIKIPTALIERVEVVTGGASATYGSDAIAGVVNFIMKTNFEGFQIDGQLGVNSAQQPQHLRPGRGGRGREHSAQGNDLRWTQPGLQPHRGDQLRGRPG